MSTYDISFCFIWFLLFTLHFCLPATYVIYCCPYSVHPDDDTNNTLNQLLFDTHRLGETCRQPRSWHTLFRSCRICRSSLSDRWALGWSRQCHHSAVRRTSDTREACPLSLQSAAAWWLRNSSASLKGDRKEVRIMRLLAVAVIFMHT